MTLPSAVKMLFAMLVLASAGAEGQALAPPKDFGRPAPGPGAAAALDVREAPMLAMPTQANSFQAWYDAQQRPALVVYFNRKLDRLPPGWRGSTRLQIDDRRQGGGNEEHRSVTIGVQHNTEAVSERKSQFAVLFEQAVQQELKRQRFRILDGNVLQRRGAAGAKPEGADTEYASLATAARFVFEVALLDMNGNFELVGELKDVHSGELTATVRQRIDGPLDTPGDLDRASRALVQRLLRYQLAES